MQFIRKSFRPTSVSCTIKLGLLTLSDFFFCVFYQQKLSCYVNMIKAAILKITVKELHNEKGKVSKKHMPSRDSQFYKKKNQACYWQQFIKGFCFGGEWIHGDYRNEIIGLLRGIGNNRNNLKTEKNLYRQYGTG